MDDADLLSAFARDASENAFETLVTRYVDLVYSAALRQVHDHEQARDVTQAVFLIFARKAGSLKPGTILSGWLYRTARFVALESARTERRRKAREATMREIEEYHEPGHADEFWKIISPKIDELLHQMKQADRDAILLRFFQGKSLGEVGAALGVTEEAAKKRVNRAVERLRRRLSRQGITGSSSILAAALLANSVQPAPTAVAAFIGLAAAQGATSASAGAVQILSEGALQMITWSKVKMTAGAAALVLAGGSVTVGIKYASVASEHKALIARQQQNEPAASALANESQWRGEIARLASENAALRDQTREIHELRAQVTHLNAQQRSLAAPTGSPENTPAPREIRATMETLRELQFEHFLAAGQKALTLQPLTEEERLGYNDQIDLMKNVGLALRIYATENGDQFPATLQALYEKGWLTETMKEKLEKGNFEYLVFADAEMKPGLPAVWSRGPDAKGIRILVLNDGSAHLIREPAAISPPTGTVKR